MPGFSQTFGTWGRSGWVNGAGSTVQRTSDKPHRGDSIQAFIGVGVAAQNSVAISGTPPRKAMEREVLEEPLALPPIKTTLLQTEVGVNPSHHQLKKPCLMEVHLQIACFNTVR